MIALQAADLIDRFFSMMKISCFLLSVLYLANIPAVRASDAAEKFLSYIFGAEDVAIENATWPNDDLWMLHGRKNEAGVAEIAQAKISRSNNVVLWEMIQNALCIVEVRDGKVDPGFSLDQIYVRHREMILRFVDASLTQDKDALGKLTTNASNVKFGRAKPPAMGDLDQYQEIIGHLPIVRISQPAADKLSKSVSYRVPLGSKGLTLRLVKRDGSWRIDSDSKIEVPLEFLFQ